MTKVKKWDYHEFHVKTKDWVKKIKTKITYEPFLERFWYDFNDMMIYFYVTYSDWKTSMLYYYIEYEKFIDSIKKSWKERSYKIIEEAVKKYFKDYLNQHHTCWYSEFLRVYRKKILVEWLDVMYKFYKENWRNY